MESLPFSGSFQSFSVVVCSVTGFRELLAPIVSMVLELVRRSVMNQYPGLVSTLLSGCFGLWAHPFLSRLMPCGCLSKPWRRKKLPS